MAKGERSGYDKLIGLILDTSKGLLISAATAGEIELESESVTVAVMAGLELAGITVAVGSLPVLVTLAILAPLTKTLSDGQLTELAEKVVPATTSGVGLVLAPLSIAVSPPDDPLLGSRVAGFLSDASGIVGEKSETLRIASTLNAERGLRSAVDDIATEMAYLNSILQRNPAPSAGTLDPHGGFSLPLLGDNPMGQGSYGPEHGFSEEFDFGNYMPGNGELGMGSVTAPSDGGFGGVGNTMTMSFPDFGGYNPPGAVDSGDDKPPYEPPTTSQPPDVSPPEQQPVESPPTNSSSGDPSSSGGGSPPPPPDPSPDD